MINWRQWRMGLLVACITGIATAFTVGLIIPAMTLKEGIFICLGSMAKDVLLFLREHPVDKIKFDTTIVTKNEINK